MYILGISCYYHDAAAALIVDGQIVAAAEEERFSRQKHDSSFPKHAIKFCLETGSITSNDLDYVVFYEKPFRKFHRILMSTLSSFPKSYLSFREAIRIWLTQKLWIKSEIAQYLKIPENKILFSEHHLSHAASCFYPSPFKESAILTIDGVGEWATASFGVGKDNKITIFKELNFPQSLGLLYSTYTAFLGFEVNEGEWKVMGLAPYGKPKYIDKVLKTVKLLKDGSFSLDFSYFSYHYSDKTSFSRKFIDLFGDPVPPQQSNLITEKSADIAASIQKVTEDILINMVRNIKKTTGMDNLCIAGGVALNSVANYKILQEAGFKNIFIQPAAGDSGGATGAALYLHHHVLNHKKRYVMSNAYLGQQFNNLTTEQFLTSSLEASASQVTRWYLASWRKGSKSSKWIPGQARDDLSNNKLINYVADLLAQGKVIGWMQGRFEWGPRALGNRTILADPRNPKMKDIINSKVKFREAFRPFAPSVLADRASLIFQLPTSNFQLLINHYPLRFMLYIVPVREAWRKKVPAITHADNTSRPQLVFKEDNPLYYSLIEAFYKKTGVPLLLNTSFNLKGEPIVNSPQDAYSTFIRSGIDVLVMGNYVLEK